MAGPFYPLSAAPAPYDIVWCRFPYLECPDQPGPKSRPALVRQAFVDEQNQPWIEVAYGTTSNPSKIGDCFFTVSKLSEMDACGLHRATRFDLARCVVLPYHADYFEVLPGYSSPVLGRLTDYGIRLLQIQLAYAERARRAE